MRKLLLASSAVAVVMAASAANAADIAAPVYKAAPPVVAAWSWTGFYIGAHVGGGWGTKEWTDQFFPGKIGRVTTNLTAASYSVNGPLGGLQAGYNYQMGWVVAGVEAQFSWADLKGRGPCLALVGGGCDTKVDWLGTAAFRLGGTVDHALLYVKAGAAWAHDKHTANDVRNTVALSSSVTDTRWGWMLGGGVEYAFTANWSGKIEYNYMDLGTQRYHFAFAFPGGGTNIFDTDITQRLHVIKIGVNYRFGGPVVASY
jgi:outer membrane immunogenic protein